MRGKTLSLIVIVSLGLLALESNAKKWRPHMVNKAMLRTTNKQLVLQRKETNPADFTRLVVMRLVYGFAKLMGLQEPVSNVMNGAFVPPGVDDYDDFDDDSDDGLFDFD